MTTAPTAGLWSGVELHVVTGKGGTGKTTVAAALALALASKGRRTLVIEVEGRQGLAQAFDVPPLGYAETKLSATPDGGQVDGLAVDPEDALLEYLDLFYKLGPAGRLLRRTGAIDFATTIAPGLRDVLLTGKVYEAVGKRRGKRQQYDAVVLDAPPTGRIGRFLNVSTEVSGLARVGPVRQQADSINGLLTSSRTIVHFVTLLEEMPVQETIDGIEELTSLGLTIGAVVMNQVMEPAHPGASHDAIDPHAIADVLRRVHLPKPVSTATALLAEEQVTRTRRELEERERERLVTLDAALVELPRISDGIDPSTLLVLARLLTEQGMR